MILNKHGMIIHTGVLWVVGDIYTCELYGTQQAWHGVPYRCAMGGWRYYTCELYGSQQAWHGVPSRCAMGG